MIKVDSSSIFSVGYEVRGGDGDLYVKFNSGKVYTYVNVPRRVYLGLIGAKSTGRYFTTYVKGSYGTDGVDPGPS